MSGILCACGKQIQRCTCGGTACPGWGHLPPAARHWCGKTREDGQPQPAGGRAMTESIRRAQVIGDAPASRVRAWGHSVACGGDA